VPGRGRGAHAGRPVCVIQPLSDSSARLRRRRIRLHSQSMLTEEQSIVCAARGATMVFSIAARNGEVGLLNTARPAHESVISQSLTSSLHPVRPRGCWLPHG
jgi:hypothetical protein